MQATFLLFIQWSTSAFRNQQWDIFNSAPSAVRCSGAAVQSIKSQSPNRGFEDYLWPTVDGLSPILIDV
jgi:hypothetical protein